MTKRSTKHSLLMSAIALLLCCSMLIGTTFAWFTDSVTSAGNIIKSGTLEVSLDWADGKTDPANTTWNDASTSKIFNYDKWEPGYTDVKHIKITNDGTLALKYVVTITAYDKFNQPVAPDAVNDLAEVIDVYYLDPAQQVADRNAFDALPASAKLGTLKDVLANLNSTATGSLEAGKSAEITLALKMQETAGNEYQDKSIGENFAVTLFATQMTYEEDSFDDQYDKDAYLPVVYNIDELKAAIENGESVKLGADMTFTEADATNGNAIYYTGDKSITIDLGGHTITGNTSNALIRIQKTEGAENTINIMNGKLVADSSTWSAISVGSSAATKTYVNMKNVEVNSSKPNDMAVRARTGAEFTMTDCKVVATNGAGGIVAGGGDITLNNVTVEQKGYYSNNWNSVALGVSGKGSITVNSGSFTSDPDGASQGTWVAYVMSSGGDLIINDGTFNGTTGSAACGLICADTAAVVEINGGTFNSTGAILDMRNNTGALPNPTATLKGGNFSADPRVSGLYGSNLISLADGYAATQNADGTWTVDVVRAMNSDELVAAINNANDGDTINLAAGDYALKFTNNTAFNVDNLTISGVEGTNLTITSTEVMYGRIQGDNVTFENINFTPNTVGATGKATYNNCTFAGRLECASSGSAETYANGCTMNNVHTSSDMTAGNAYFKNCTMDSAVYGRPNNDITITFENCTIGTLKPWNVNTTLINCNVTEFDFDDVTTATIIVDGVVVK